MTTGNALNGKQYAGNPHVLFDVYRKAFLIAIIAAAFVSVGFADEYYVDDAGSDANHGTAPGAAGAKKTFQGLFAEHTLSSGDVVHVAPGVYASGEMDTKSKGTITGRYRAVIPAGVTVVADQGPDVTAIEGEKDTVNGTEETYWCGPNAFHCVSLGAGAVLRGFTLRNGYSSSFTSDSTANYGAAVNAWADTTALIVDCVISNCYAPRAAGIEGGTAIRCRFDDNRAYTTGCDMMDGNSFGCVFGNLQNVGSYNIYKGTLHVNNTFYGTGKCAHFTGPTRMVNSVFIGKEFGSSVVLSNSLTTVQASSNQPTLVGGSRKVAEEDLMLGADYRPMRGSPLIDAGDSAAYIDQFPEAAAAYIAKDILENDRIVGGTIDIGACESHFGTGAADWYVDGGSGSDANDGYSVATAFKTLPAALTNASIRSGDTVHAAAGTYTDTMTTSGGTAYRAVVPEGVTLLADAGADDTAIEGAADTGEGVTQGCGPNAIRCVYLGANAVLRGFTVRNGHATGLTDAASPGGVNATASGAVVVDCVISNCVAQRGGGIRGGTAIRCRFDKNVCGITGSDIWQGAAYNCVFGDVDSTSGTSCNVYQGGPFVNCTFHGVGNACHQSGSSYNRNIKNSIVAKSAGRNIAPTNSITLSMYSTADMKLDENHRPLKDSPAVDAGDPELYTAPAGFADTDFGGGQRVYNGKIDLGAFEYDWRGDFARALGSSRVAVVSADGTVVTNTTGGVTVPAGASLGLVWSFSCNGRCEFNVAAVDGGTVSVLLDGVEMEPVNGVYSFAGTAGSQVSISISCEGEGCAVASSFHLYKGLVFTVR